jgi:hypothetical protein
MKSDEVTKGWSDGVTKGGKGHGLPPAGYRMQDARCKMQDIKMRVTSNE